MTEEIALTIQQFIKDNEITLEIEGGIDPRHMRSITPVKDADGWEHYAWVVTLKRDGLTLTTSYHTGTGHSTSRENPVTGAPILTPTPPRVEDVLDSLKVDASSYDNARDFEDFANDFGYSTDSRKAEALYLACGEQAKKLRFFLGRELYDDLLWKVESL